MESHELRLDYSGQLRSIEPQNEALFYRPYGNDLSISESYKKHVEGARRNTSASKLLRHAFVQFPTNIEITPQTQEMMLKEAVAFINKTHGGRAVFHGRIDRDEKGKHGVDVFFAPRYEKKTAKDLTDWISLTKFGKERARERLGQKQEEKYNKKTKEWEPQFKADGSPKMVWQDSAYFQGQVLQDDWFEHLRDVVGLTDGRIALVFDLVSGPTLAALIATRGHLRPGETVWIPAAAGGVGSCAVQIALRAGAHVIASAGSAAKLDHLRDTLGATEVFDRHDDRAGALACPRGPRRTAP